MKVIFNGISHSFGKQEKLLLNIPKLTLSSGEVTLVVGKNGSGKTTLLRILAGLLSANTIEELTINGNISQQKQLRAIATLMHQHPQMLRSSVRNNLQLVCRWRGRKVEDASRIQQLLQDLRLTNYAEKQAIQLSHGQQQRLALARAIIIDTPIVLLDEPDSNIDSESIEVVQTLCTRMLEKQRILVISSHEQNILTPDQVINCNSGESNN